MKKFFLKFICLTIIFSLLLSSSTFPAFGKCDSEDERCKLKKQAERGCRDADNVDGCKMERKTAQDKIEDIQKQKQAGMAPTVSPEETDPQKAGDLVWGKCKEAGGNDDSCKAQAQEAFLKVEKDHPVDPATKEQYIVRDALRTTALKEVGGSENLSYEQAERIRQQSDLAAAPVPRDEYKQDFNDQLTSKYGQNPTQEQIDSFSLEYYQQNKDHFRSAISQEADLAKLGKDLLNQKSVSLYLEEEVKKEEAARTAAEAEARRQAEEKAKQQLQAAVQQAVQTSSNCQTGEPVVNLLDAGEFSGWYRCRDKKRITEQDAARLNKQYELATIKESQLRKLELKNQNTTPATMVSPKQIESMREILASMADTFRQRRLIGTKEKQLAAIEQGNQDFIPATMVSPEQIESMKEILKSMVDTFRQRRDPLGDNDSDGDLNFNDCAPDDERYQGDCPDQVGASPQYEVYYSDAKDLQIKGVITNNGQLVAGKIILEGINPETGKYEVIPVEFDRYGQFTSNPFNLTIGPLVEPVILQAIVYMNGKPRRVIVPIIPSEEGVFSIQNIHLEDYAVGTEDELIRQVREKYNLNLVNGPNPENLWTAQEIQWFEETIDELPPIFWQTETTDFYRDSNDRYLGTTETRALYSLYPLLGSPVITLSDGIYSLNNRTWTANAKSDDTKGFFQQILVHEITHAIQYHDPANTPLETIIKSSDEWDKAHPELNNWSTSFLGAINTYSNPLVQDYMKTIGWGVDWMTVSLFTFREIKSDNPSVYEDAPTAYAKTNPLEDMSESAMLYVDNPEYLRDRSPERYEWLKNNIFSGREYLTGSSNNTLLEQIIKKNSLYFPSFQFTAQANQSLSPTSLEKIESVRLGMSRNEVVNILGEPISERTISGNTFLSYSSSNPQIAHVIVLKNNRVIFIDIYKGKENPEKLSEYIEKFGEPEKTTYSYFVQGAKVLIFARQGIALIVLGDSEYVTKKQIFSPMSIEEFLNTLGKNLPLSDPFDQVGTSNPGTPENTFEIKEGWNLIALPFVPSEVWSASDLVTDVARQGGYITSVSRWNNGRWEAYIQRGDEPYGQDFPLEPGVGYILRGHLPVNWVASGFQITSPLPLSLKKGYNLVGVVSANFYSATSTIDAINSQAKEEVARTVTRFESGLYEPLVKQKGEIYGEDYPIEKTRGYFIRVEEDINWTP